MSGGILIVKYFNPNLDFCPCLILKKKSELERPSIIRSAELVPASVEYLHGFDFINTLDPTTTGNVVR